MHVTEIEQGCRVENRLGVHIAKVRHRNCLENEAQGDQNTAGGNERNHVGDTGHHSLVDARAPSAFGSACAVLTAGCGSGNACTVGVLGLSQSLRNHFLRLVNTALDGRLNKGLTCEAVTLTHVHGHRENHGVCGVNISLSQLLVTRGALGFNLQVVAELFSSVLEGVRSHVGVSDTGGACGHSNNLLHRNRSGGCFLLSSRYGGCSLGGLGLCLLLAHAECTVDQLNNLFSRGGFAQGCGEALLHQGACQGGEQLQVSLVSAIGCSDEENQVGGAVLCTEGNCRVGACHCQGRLGDGGATAVRNRNTAGDAGVGLGFACLGSRVELLEVGSASGVYDCLGELGNYVESGLTEILVQQDEICGNQIRHIPSSGMCWGGGFAQRCRASPLYEFKVCAVCVCMCSVRICVYICAQHPSLYSLLRIKAGGAKTARIRAAADE